MNKADAIFALLKDARSERNSFTSYKRVKRALDSLGVDAEGQNMILRQLDYMGYDNQLYAYLCAGKTARK